MLYASSHYHSLLSGCIENCTTTSFINSLGSPIARHVMDGVVSVLIIFNWLRAEYTGDSQMDLRTREKHPLIDSSYPVALYSF